MTDAPTLLWLEDDLRIGDHAAFAAAAARGHAIIPCFVWNGGTDWADGGASRWWLHHSLVAMRERLAALGLPLIIREGDPESTIPALAKEASASAVFWMERPDPLRRQRDDRIRARLVADGTEARVYGGTLLHNPDAIRTGSGGPYKVFTPFYRKFRAETEVDRPVPAPTIQDAHRPSEPPSSLSIDDLGLLPRHDWAGGLRDTWTPGESGAQSRIARFEGDCSVEYALARDIPSSEGTSRLSPHLHFGEVTARQVWHRIADAAGEESAEPYLRQLAWREFAHHLLHHFPDTRREPLKAKYAAFPWTSSPEYLKRWQQGRTGYPIVDAGMRQLWTTGWMHNRVRMIVASFLTKDLLLHWQEGLDWFRDTLVDADVANNAMGWQWAAGSGADAQPFFRIFNPVSQGERFDPDGDYVREWVPELASTPKRWIHRPWEGPSGSAPTYPSPIVDHADARLKALEAYETIKG